MPLIASVAPASSCSSLLAVQPRQQVQPRQGLVHQGLSRQEAAVRLCVHAEDPPGCLFDSCLAGMCAFLCRFRATCLNYTPGRCQQLCWRRQQAWSCPHLRELDHLLLTAIVPYAHARFVNALLCAISNKVLFVWFGFARLRRAPAPLPCLPASSPSSRVAIKHCVHPSQYALPPDNRTVQTSPLKRSAHFWSL